MLFVMLPILSGCDGPAPTSTTRDSGPVADPGRSTFEDVQLSETRTRGLDPLSLARELFGAREPMEGLYSEEVETLAASAERQVVLFTQMELPDDSVRGMRHRLEFLLEDGQWHLVWVGRQVLCRPGRGREDWGTAPCL